MIKNAIQILHRHVQIEKISLRMCSTTTLDKKSGDGSPNGILKY